MSNASAFIDQYAAHSLPQHCLPMYTDVCITHNSGISVSNPGMWNHPPLFILFLRSVSSIESCVFSRILLIFQYREWIIFLSNLLFWPPFLIILQYTEWKYTSVTWELHLKVHEFWLFSIAGCALELIFCYSNTYPLCSMHFSVLDIYQTFMEVLGRVWKHDF